MHMFTGAARVVPGAVDAAGQEFGDEVQPLGGRKIIAHDEVVFGQNHGVGSWR